MTTLARAFAEAIAIATVGGVLAAVLLARLDRRRQRDQETTP